MQINPPLWPSAQLTGSISATLCSPELPLQVSKSEWAVRGGAVIAVMRI